MDGSGMKQEQRRGLGSSRPESQAPRLCPPPHPPITTPRLESHPNAPALSRRKARKVASQPRKTEMGIRG